MPEVLALKIALFAVPVIALLGSLFTGKPESPLVSFLIGCAASLVIFIVATVSWRIEDSRKEKKYLSRKAS